MDRILQSTPATISESWYQGATIQDPGTVAVTVTRDDGTIVTTGTAAGTGATPRTFQLTAADTASLDRLTATWTSPTLGTLTTVIEVVGDFLFTINEAHNAGLASYSDDQIAGARTRVEQAIEDACGLAFVPRYDRAMLNGDGTTLLRLGRPFLRRVRWASTVTAGVTTALLTTDLSMLSISTAGFVSGYTWPSGYGNVLVGFEHGMDRPPETVRAAALDYARFLLTQDTSIDSRVTQLQTDDGTLVFGGGQTGLPGVDRVIDQYRVPAIA
jgi:hypothetical protein